MQGQTLGMRSFFEWFLDDSLKGADAFLRWLLCLLCVAGLTALGLQLWVHGPKLLGYLIIILIAFGWRRRR